MKTKEQIALETPLSITVTDNPIFEINLDAIGENTVAVLNQENEFVMINNKERYRLLGCNLVESTEENTNPTSPFRLGESEIIYIPASILVYVNGELGEEFSGNYDI
jgi:hypothetical protein